MSLTVAIMFIATALYGVVVSGMGNHMTVYAAIAVTFGSLICSLFFEAGLAK